MPGQPIGDLVDFNQPVLAASGNDPRFRVGADPGARQQQLPAAPRLQLEPAHEGGALGWLTGGDKLVLRGGYARTHDYAFTNIAAQHLELVPVRRGHLVAADGSGGRHQR